ncbi:hypothetical protein SFRURICE_017787 [Spodoptera frugiperda]|nr:hypothetical protein SFRURICE_017787 [Spodoptera frugiperda]
MISCDCGSSYIGETRRNITTRLKEHIRSVKNWDPYIGSSRACLKRGHGSLPPFRQGLRTSEGEILRTAEIQILIAMAALDDK